MIPKSVSEISHMPPDEHQLVQRFFSEGNFLDTFSVGCSFREKVCQQVIPHMLLSKGTFMDGLLVCVISWLEDIDDKDNSGRLSTCYRYASSALATLASVQVTDFQIMTDSLMLSAMVSTFAVKLQLNDILAITSCTLGLIEPVYAVSDPDRLKILVFMSCMVIWEI